MTDEQYHRQKQKEAAIKLREQIIAVGAALEVIMSDDSSFAERDTAVRTVQASGYPYESGQARITIGGCVLFSDVTWIGNG